VFDHKHYVPILRWKRAERVALRFLTEQVKSYMTPLIEVTPRSFSPRASGRVPPVDEVLSHIAEDLLASWGTEPIFIDLWLLNPSLSVRNGLHPFIFLAAEARARGVSLIPVTGLDRDDEYQNAVASLNATNDGGVCVRLVRSDLERSALRTDLNRLLSRLHLQERQAHLLVNWQFVQGGCPDWTAALRSFPDLRLWRTLTVASGAFPPDLTRFTLGQHDLPRLDRLAWRRQVALEDPSLRRAAYGDYTIQNPIYSEPPGLANVSASIRYTADEHWVIMRGEGLRNENGPGHAQYPANALLLRRRPEYCVCGPNFSYGDAYIHDKSEHPDPPGNPETWLRAGFNHHMTFVVRQVASLFVT